MEEKGIYLIGQDIMGCKCGQGDHSVISYFVQTTRYIEKVSIIYADELTFKSNKWWECEKCEEKLYMSGHKPWFKFCPMCGRKITEFVRYQEPEEEEDA